MKKVEFDISFKTFEELSLNELYDILRLRTEIFVVEQNCPYQELDENDQKSIHLLCKIKGHLVGYLRILFPGVVFENFTIGRVVVSNDFRKMGIAREMMLLAIDKIETEFHSSKIMISAQTYLINFYENLDFKPIGEEYLEDNIPHIDMQKGE